MSTETQTEPAAQETAHTPAESRPLDIDSAERGAYDALLRRVADAPVSFDFTWRGIDFRGRIESCNGRLRLAITSTIAALPFSVESPEARQAAIAAVKGKSGADLGDIHLRNGNRIVFETMLELVDQGVGMVNNLVTLLTVAVLRAAPYLDLIAERTVSYRTAAAMKLNPSAV